MSARSLVVFIAFIHFAASCDTGRLFLGSINETYPLEVDKNGIYLRQPDDFGGYPLYKHESRDFFLYHVTGNILPPFWVVASNPGSLSGSISIQTSAANPEEAEEKWAIWSESDREWREERHLKAVCVDSSFVTCTTGTIQLHGLSPWNYHQENLTGLYTITNDTHELRPVYKHDTEDDYLYYVNGLWMVGPVVGQVSAGLFVLDYAWRPEYIVDTWVVFNGAQFLRDTRMKISCRGPGAESGGLNLPPKSEVAISDILTIAEGMLNEEDQLPLCTEQYCQNGGTCITNEVGTRLCACVDGFLGRNCETVVTCGTPTPIDHGTVSSQTGDKFHDLAFYECAEDFQRVGPTASVCQGDGQWSGQPACVDWLDYLNPGIQPVRRDHSRRHFMNVPRNRQNSRSKRSLVPVDLDKLKEMF